VFGEKVVHDRRVATRASGGDRLVMFCEDVSVQARRVLAHAISAKFVIGSQCNADVAFADGADLIVAQEEALERR
jgi:hypothetical protein